MKTKYFLIVAIILLSAIVFLQMNLHDQTQKELIEKFKTEQEIIARHLAEGVQTFLQEETDRIKSFVLFQGLQHGKMSEIKTLVDEDFEYFKKDHVKSINVYDKNGTIIYSTSKDAIGNNNTENKFFRWATTPENKSEPFISSDSIENINRSPQMPSFSLLIAMPVYQNIEKTVKVKSTQSLLGVVTIIIDLEETLNNLFPRISADVKKENVMILDKDGTLWFQSEHPEMVMKNIFVHDKSCFQCHISFDYLGKMLSEKQGRIDYELKKGPRKIASFSSFEFKNIAWTVVLNHEYSEVTRFLDQSYIQSLIIIGSIIFTLLGLTILSFRSNRLRIRAQEEATIWREKLELEEKIRESEEHYRKVVDNSSDAIIIHCEGKIVFANPAAVELIGASGLHDLIGIPAIEFVHPDEREFISKHILEIFKNEKPSSWHEERYIRMDGGIINVEAIGTPTTFNGKPSMQVIIHDITQRKQAEEAIKREIDFSQNSLDSLPGVFYLFDIHGKFLRWNKNVEIITGYSAEEIKNLSPLDLFDKPEKMSISEKIENIFKIGEDTIEANVLSKDKTRTLFFMTGKRFLYENTLCILGVGIDISDQKKAEEDLRNERLLLRTVIDNIPDSIYCKDTASRKTLANLSNFRNAGLESEAEILGKTDFDLHPKELAEGFYADDQLVLQSGQPLLNKEEYVILRNGEKKWQLTSKLPLKDKDGIIIGLVGIGRDITSRRLAEEALRESEIKLNVILQSTADGILAIDSDGKIIKTNKRFAELWRIPQPLIDSRDDNALLSFVLDQLTNPDEFISKVQKLYHSTDEDLDHLYFKDDRTFERFSAPLVMADSSIGRVWSFRDITERKQTEELLKESEKKFRLLIENQGEGLTIVDPDENLLFVNPAAESIFGVEPGMLVGQNLKKFIVSEQFDQVRNETGKREKNEKSSYEVDILTPAGIKRNILVTATPQNDENGKFIGTFGVIRDITERKQAEQEIKHKNEELQKLNTEKDKFFSIIAHDLRSPFNGFLGLTQIMADESSSLSTEEFQQMAASMEKSASNLFRLLENLLHWARVQQGLIPFNPIVVQLLPIADESIAIIQEQAKIKKIEIARSISDDLTVFADYNMLQTIIRNIVSNAVKFTPKGGKVMLSAKPAGDNFIVIAIKDTGIGMSQAIVEQLFRLDVNTNRIGTEGEPSTGLGLILCKEFVEKHGGQIWVESEVEKGSTFYFTLPVNPQD